MTGSGMNEFDEPDPQAETLGDESNDIDVIAPEPPADGRDAEGRMPQ